MNNNTESINEMVERERIEKDQLSDIYSLNWNKDIIKRSESKHIIETLIMLVLGSLAIMGLVIW